MENFDSDKTPCVEFVILSNGKEMYSEAYEFNSACVYMSPIQRKRCLAVLKVVFPQAFENIE